MEGVDLGRDYLVVRDCFMERVSLGCDFSVRRIGLVGEIIINLTSGLIGDLFIVGEKRGNISYRSSSRTNLYLYEICVISLSFR